MRHVNVDKYKKEINEYDPSFLINRTLIIDQTCPQQDNNIDCGVYVIFAAKDVIFKRENWTAADRNVIKQWR